MLTYIIKRLFLMIPTFLAISLMVFAIVNFAPGNPGAKQAGAEGGQQANTGEQRESYRIFKEQFNLDKPVLLNFRYDLSNQRRSDFKQCAQSRWQCSPRRQDRKPRDNGKLGTIRRSCTHGHFKSQ